jgi:hypothetical protein
MEQSYLSPSRTRIQPHTLKLSARSVSAIVSLYQLGGLLLLVVPHGRKLLVGALVFIMVIGSRGSWGVCARHEYSLVMAVM